jgi:quercetin dioxygenase-like cupin family protein
MPRKNAVCFQAGQYVQKQGWAASRHQHPFIEVMILARGTFEVSIYGEKAVATAGDAVVYPPSTPHAEHAISRENVELFCFGIEGELDPAIG